MLPRACKRLFPLWIQRTIGDWRVKAHRGHPNSEISSIYSDPRFINYVEHWGEGTVWKELMIHFQDKKGRVLDIACGPGPAIGRLKIHSELDIHGCDLSEAMVRRAIRNGIRPEQLTVCDATSLIYPDGHFDYAYSIGSLEHFSPAGILKFLRECARVTKKHSLHMVPASWKEEDLGWINMRQPYLHQSKSWWKATFLSVFRSLEVIPSIWKEGSLNGYWFICKEPY